MKITIEGFETPPDQLVAELIQISASHEPVISAKLPAKEFITGTGLKTGACFR